MFGRLPFLNWLDNLSPSTKGWLCLLLGAGGALSLAPISIPFFFLFGFAVLAALLQKSQDWKNTFFLSWLYALGFHTAGLYWISASLFIDIQRYLWVLPFSLLALPCYLAFLFALAASAAHFLRNRPLIYFSALALFVFGSEVARTFLFSGFPWNLFGYIWSDHLAIMQSAALFGIWGLTLFTLFCAASAASALTCANKSAWLFVLGTWGALSALGLWGSSRLSAQNTYFENTHIRLVQAAIKQTERRSAEQRIDAFDKHIGLSLTPSPIKPTAIIWPETAAPFFMTSNAQARAQLKTIIPDGGALLTGAPSLEKSKFYNSLVVIDSRTDVVGVYDKHHLVPFGEYIPLRKTLKALPLATDVIGNGSDFSAGTGPKTLTAPGLPPFSPMICYEAIFSGGIIDTSTPPQWLLQITNDAWFGDTSGPYQHLAMARVRAIEEGLPLVRAANSGISALIDPYGRILSELPLNESGILDIDLPQPLKAQTPYRLLFQ